jgi:hypothetical protein
MNARKLATDERQFTTQSAAKSNRRKIRYGMCHAKDEPDTFRCVIERWTVRFMLVVATILLGTEVLPWLIHKVRHCVFEIMDDNTAQR